MEAWGVWGLRLVFIVARPIVVVFVRPAPLLSLLSGPAGAKIGAAPLLGAVVVMAAIIAWPFVGPTFPKA